MLKILRVDYLAISALAQCNYKCSCKSEGYGKIKVELCHPADSKDAGRGHKPRNARHTALEVRKEMEIDAPLYPLKVHGLAETLYLLLLLLFFQ
jgi:hypothetical protein